MTFQILEDVFLATFGETEEKHFHVSPGEWATECKMRLFFVPYLNLDTSSSCSLLSALSLCKPLTYLDLRGSTVNGCLSQFIPKSDKEYPRMFSLDLSDTKLNGHDLKHLTHLLEQGKMSRFGKIHLDHIDFSCCEAELEELKETHQSYYGRELEICQPEVVPEVLPEPEISKYRNYFLQVHRSRTFFFLYFYFIL